MGVKGSLPVQPIDKDKIIRDILNNVDRRVESRPTPSSNLVKKPEIKMNDFAPMEVPHLPFGRKSNSNPESDSKPESHSEENEVSEQSDPDSEENESSEQSDLDSEENETSDQSDPETESPDNCVEIKEAFRNLYMDFHRDIGVYSKLELMLNKLEKMGCMTKEEYNNVKEHLQKKIEFSEGDEDRVNTPEELKDAFINLHNKFLHNTTMYKKLVRMLDEMEWMNFLTKEECNGINENLKEKIAL